MELDAVADAFDEERCLRLIATTRNTRDPQHRARLRAFHEDIEPLWRPRFVAVERRLLASSRVGTRERYREFLRALELEHRIFREENLPRLAKENVLRAEYNALVGQTSVVFEGAEETLPRMQAVAEDRDRGRRERAWRAIAARRGADAARYEEIFERLRVLREEIARAAGCPDYVSYRFLELHRPYAPADCEQYFDAVRVRVLPLLRSVQARRRAALGVETLRPWDLDVALFRCSDFASHHELVDRARAGLRAVDPNFERCLCRLRNEDLVDLGTRAGKAPGGYTCFLPRRGMPFVFLNTTGASGNLYRLLHEVGHAIHYCASRDQQPGFNRHPPIEFGEVAALSMELLALDALGDDAMLARQLETVVRRLAWVALIDAHQRRLYGGGEGAWLELFRELRGDVCWTGLEDEERRRWHEQPHLFRSPLYYIEYGIAQIGALQLWRNFRQNRKVAVRAFRRAMALGGARPLHELFAAAGATFDMGDAMLAGLVEEVAERLRSVE